MTAWRSENLSHFAVETYAATTGSALNWLCNEMRWFENAREISELAATVPSSNGLFFMPTLTGLRQPNIVPDGRASLTGLSMAHSRAHLAHAILEGIAHSVVSCAEASSEVAGVPVREVVAGGGFRPAIRCFSCRLISAVLLCGAWRIRIARACGAPRFWQAATDCSGVTLRKRAPRCPKAISSSPRPAKRKDKTVERDGTPSRMRKSHAFSRVTIIKQELKC